MTKEEAVKIKEEILNKQGSVSIGNALVIDDVIRIDDTLNIINKHIESDSYKPTRKD